MMLHPIQAHPRERGIALLTTLAALLIAVVMAVSYLNAQATSTGIAQNADRHTTARHIAESALMVGIEYVKTNPSWRTDRPYGTWISNQELLGGTFTLRGENEYADFSHPDAEALTLTVTARFQNVSHTVRAVVVGETSQGGAGSVGIAVHSDIKLSNNARISAADSRTDAYVPGSNGPRSAFVATNSTRKKGVSIDNNAFVYGDMFVGPGGNPQNVIDGINRIAGNVGSLAESTALPSITPPPNLPNNAQSDPDYGANHSQDMPPGTYRYSDFTVGNNFTLRIHGDTVIYCDGEFEIKNNAEVLVMPGATLTVYADTFTLGNNGTLATDGTADPSRITLLQTGSGNSVIENNFDAAAQILAPHGTLELKNNASFFGSFMGQKLEMSNNSRFVQDLALGPMQTGGGGSGQSRQFRAQWIEHR